MERHCNLSTSIIFSFMLLFHECGPLSSLSCASLLSFYCAELFTDVRLGVFQVSRNVFFRSLFPDLGSFLPRGRESIGHYVGPSVGFTSNKPFRTMRLAYIFSASYCCCGMWIRPFSHFWQKNGHWVCSR